MKYFTTYWKNSTWQFNQLNSAMSLLDHTASQAFRDRVQPGDALYIVTNLAGDMFVACKIVVDRVTDGKTASAILANSDLWPANHHVIASRSTYINWERKVPRDVVERLEFYVGAGAKGAEFDTHGRLDRQTLRGTRELTETSAKLLDRLLGPLVDIETGPQSLWEDESREIPSSELESAVEGEPKKRFVTYYERIRKNRDAAIRFHGLTCKGCEINFEETYGELGEGFIHVHHTVPVSEFEHPKQPDIGNEMVVLCPNCHAMVHRKKSATLSVDELRRIIHDNRTR